MLFAGCALTDATYIVDMSLLIIANLFLLRALDAFRRSKATGVSQPRLFALEDPGLDS